jgi:hypothetical protein
MLRPAFLVSDSTVIPNSALLDLVFTNINEVYVSISDYPVVTLDNYHLLCCF